MVFVAAIDAGGSVECCIGLAGRGKLGRPVADLNIYTVNADFCLKKGPGLRRTGGPGVGKTHLAVALALKVIEHGQRAYFVRAYDLMEDLRKARTEHNLDRRMRVYLAPKVLIVDEFGIWPYDRESATAFFTLVSARYERGSIILTSNKGFGEWGELCWGPP